MLGKHRRLLIVCMACLTLAPALIHLASKPATISMNENRALAPSPGFPNSVKELASLPRRLDAYLMDHFGFRDAMVGLHGWAMAATFSAGGNAKVFSGADGWMFYRGDRMLEQSSGRIMRDAELRRTARMLGSIRKLLASRGVKLVVAPPPNSATIYHDKIEGWPRSVNETEYDRFIALAAQEHVGVLDLRPVLREARREGDTYLRHDTHWNAWGAVAAFNAIAAAGGLADWRLRREEVIGPETVLQGGELARMLGIADAVEETERPLRLAGDFERTQISDSPAVVEVAPKAARGATILILGDSFSERLFPLIAANGGRAIWTHHVWCGFDWRLVERYRPDQVWYLPTERYIPCDPSKTPKNLPAMEVAVAP
jgi:alginate O-acetyltransferase complex protein AlgJ